MTFARTRSLFAMLALLIAPLALLAPTAAVAHDHGDEGDEPTQTIAEIAAGDDRFSTLVTALEAAELVAPLADEDATLTVFAPTNDAFAALPEGTVETLLEPANREALQQVLLHHVTASVCNAQRLANVPALRTLAKTGITCRVTDDGAFVGLPRDPACALSTRGAGRALRDAGEYC